MANAPDCELQRAVEHMQLGNWDDAHSIVQKRVDPLACRVHALLHRIEGDLANAAYWYQRAGVPAPAIDPEQELQVLAVEIADQ